MIENGIEIFVIVMVKAYPWRVADNGIPLREGEMRHIPVGTITPLRSDNNSLLFKETAKAVGHKIEPVSFSSEEGFEVFGWAILVDSYWEARQIPGFKPFWLWHAYTLESHKKLYGDEQGEIEYRAFVEGLR